MTATTATEHASPHPSRGHRFKPLALALLLLFGMGKLAKQRRILGRMLCGLLLLDGGVVATLLSGCDSLHFSPEAPVSYAVNVTGTSGNLQHTATFTINEQP